MTDDLGALVADVCRRNEEAIDAAAAAVVATADHGGLVRTAGAGHSLAAVMETFFRAGGLAFVRPMWHPRVLPLNGARAATAAEREPGLGLEIARASGMQSVDTVVVFSNSGINPYPVEIAEHARDLGTTVVAVTSVQASTRAPLRARRRLMEAADIVLDTGVGAGDVTWPPDDPVTAPSSSLANTALWSGLLRAVHRLAPDAPRWRSANVAGTDGFNRELEARFGPMVPEL